MLFDEQTYIFTFLSQLNGSGSLRHLESMNPFKLYNLYVVTLVYTKFTTLGRRKTVKACTRTPR